MFKQMFKLIIKDIGLENGKMLVRDGNCNETRKRFYRQNVFVYFLDWLQRAKEENPNLERICAPSVFPILWAGGIAPSTMDAYATGNVEGMILGTATTITFGAMTIRKYRQIPPKSSSRTPEPAGTPYSI